MSRAAEEKSDSGAVELVESFVNTLHIDGDVREEELADAAALTAWIRANAGVEVDRLDARDHARALNLRESLRALLLTHNGAVVGPEELAPLRRAAAQARVSIELEEGGEVALAPADSGLAAFEVKLLLAIAGAQALGTWERLKACLADDCQWAFYDSSRNRSRTWCSMEVCGNRAKTRRYRRRRAQG